MLKGRVHIGIKALTAFLVLISVFAAGTTTAAERSKVLVKLETSQGDIVLELDAEKAPATVENFIKYAEAGHYDGTIFHRVIENFMIQGGGFDENMVQKPTDKPVQNEADNGLSNDAYTVAMARTPDPHSATAQFFINVNNNNFLNFKSKSPNGWGYTVFGRVVEGKDVVDKIKAVSTATKGFHENVPETPVVIQKVVVEK